MGGKKGVDAGPIQSNVLVNEKVAESCEISEIVESLLADNASFRECGENLAVGKWPRQRESRDEMRADIKDRFDGQLQEPLSRTIVSRISKVSG